MEDDLDQLRDPAWGLMTTERSMLVYNSSIAKKIAKNFPYNGNLLEFGASIGTLATLFKTTRGLKPKCLEIDPNLKRILVDRGFKCSDNIQQIDELFDGVYTSNVLD